MCSSHGIGNITSKYADWKVIKCWYVMPIHKLVVGECLLYQLLRYIVVSVFVSSATKCKLVYVL